MVTHRHLLEKWWNMQLKLEIEVEMILLIPTPFIDSAVRPDSFMTLERIPFCGHLLSEKYSFNTCSY